MLMVDHLHKKNTLSTSCACHNVIECSFGRLKTHFGALKYAMDVNLSDLPYIIYSYFILHNVCELNHETIGEDQVQQAVHYDKIFVLM